MIMLILNLDISELMCNGTCLVFTYLSNNVIKRKIQSRYNQKKETIIKSDTKEWVDWYEKRKEQMKGNGEWKEDK